MRKLILIAALMLAGCGNARMPNDVVEDGLRDIRAKLEHLVGATKADIKAELGEPSSISIDAETQHEIMNYQLTDADAQLILNLQQQLETYLLQQHAK